MVATFSPQDNSSAPESLENFDKILRDFDLQFSTFSGESKLSCSENARIVYANSDF